jgi:hypothetical protein
MAEKEPRRMAPSPADILDLKGYCVTISSVITEDTTPHGTTGNAVIDGYDF